MLNRSKLVMSIIALMATITMPISYAHLAKDPLQEASIDEFTAYLDGRITKMMKNHEIPGASVALIHEGRMIWLTLMASLTLKRDGK